MLGIREIGDDFAVDIAQQIASRICAKMSADIDAALGDVIRDYLGLKELDVGSLPSILRGRMFATRMPDGSTEYRIDEQPILWVGPARTELAAGTMHMNFDMRRLLSEETRNES